MADDVKRDFAWFVDRVPHKAGWFLLGALSAIGVMLLAAAVSELTFFLIHGRW